MCRSSWRRSLGCCWRACATATRWCGGAPPKVRRAPPDRSAPRHAPFQPFLRVGVGFQGGEGRPPDPRPRADQPAAAEGERRRCAGGVAQQLLRPLRGRLRLAWCGPLHVSPFHFFDPQGIRTDLCPFCPPPFTGGGFRPPNLPVYRTLAGPHCIQHVWLEDRESITGAALFRRFNFSEGTTHIHTTAGWCVPGQGPPDLAGPRGLPVPGRAGAAGRAAAGGVAAGGARGPPPAQLLHATTLSFPFFFCEVLTLKAVPKG